MCKPAKERDTEKKYFRYFFHSVVYHFNNLDSLKHKIFFPIDKLSLANGIASSGLRENVFPFDFYTKFILYNIIFHLAQMLCACNWMLR